VRRAIEAIYTVLHCNEEGIRGLDVAKEWNRIQKMLSNDGFVQSVLHFDVASLDRAPHVAEYVAEKYFPGLLQEAQLMVIPCPASSKTFSARGDLAPVIPKGLQADTPATESSSLPQLGPTSRRHRHTVSNQDHVAYPPSFSSFFARTAAPSAPLEGLLPAAPGAVPTTTAMAGVGTAQALGATARRGYNRDQKKRSLFSGKTSTEALHENETLDIAAVEYASRACGAMVHWVSEVLREFFALRELRLQREALHQQLEELGMGSREEAITQLQEEIQRLSEELENWRGRLAELRAREAEAERARANLLMLSRLEMRAGRGAKLQPVVVPSAPSLEARVLRAVSMLEVQRKPKTLPVATENAAWPPRGRKYLHIMSSPAFPP